MAWSAGERLGDQLRLVRLLVPAISDKVWLADQLFWRKPVVVKPIPTALPADDRAARAALAKRAARARLLKSPHFTPCLSYDVAPDGTPYVLLEVLKGETLDRRLARGPMRERDAQSVVKQIAHAVDEAHQQGFIHSALKADNVFLCTGPAASRVRVLNLGVALVVPPEYGDYASPEQRLGKAVDTRTDVWSLGVIAYELLTCRRPFDRQGRTATDWDFAPPSELLGDSVPGDLDAFFERVFALDPADRFASMPEAAEAYTEALLNPRQPPSVVNGVRPSRIGRHHIVDVGESWWKDDDGGGSDESREP